MKRKLLLLTAILFVALGVTQAQGGGQGPRRTVEERVKAVNEKLAEFKLDKEKQTLSDSAFYQYYRAQDKLREEMMAGGGQPDFQAMREKMQPLTNERDEKLKKVFSADQFKKWKDEIEPSLRPQRRQGGGNGN